MIIRFSHYILFSFLLILLGCNNDKSFYGYKPTDKIAVKKDMEEIKESLDKKSWLEAIHKSAPETDWRVIESKNAYRNYINTPLPHKSKVTIADVITAEWEERGSVNQAGSIIKTAFDHIEERLYAISDGGSIWSASASNIRVGESLDWSVFEDKLRFNGRFLEVVYPQDDQARIISAINGIPQYKEGIGLWSQAQGFENVERLIAIDDPLILGDGKDIFFLGQESPNTNVKLYASNDYGLSYEVVQTFNSNSIHNYGMDSDVAGNTFYLIERKTASSSNIWKWNSDFNLLQIFNGNTSVGFGSEGRANIKTSVNNNMLHLYVLNGDNNLYRSINNGISWQYLYHFPDDTHYWEGGLFISKIDPDLMIMCGVEAIMSRDGGSRWNVINGYEEYYEDIQHKLHADIMSVEEYDEGSFSFMTICNHGGISSSIDLAHNIDNIGLNGLNVSQYYSVRTMPDDDRYIFAGSQDQGLQRAFVFEEGTANFSQFFSGDFGHLQFTNDDKSLWAVFPGGDVVYYADPKTELYPTHEFSLGTLNYGSWIPPIVKNPNTPNGILQAGGNTHSNEEGSYLIDRRIINGTPIPPVRYSFNFKQHGGDITAIAYNEFDSNIIYVLTSNGKFFISTNNGRTFNTSETPIADADYFYGHNITCSKVDSDLIYITGSGYDNAPLFRSTDGGLNFEPFDEGLPRTTVFDLALTSAENFIYAATEAGPYVYIKEKERWFAMAKGIAPAQAYWSVENLNDEIIRYGTYGRGIWDFDVLKTTSVAETLQSDKLTAYPNPSFDYIQLDNTHHTVMSVIDHQGQIISTLPIRHGVNKLNISHYADGVYYLIFDEDLNSSIRFIKI